MTPSTADRRDPPPRARGLLPLLAVLALFAFAPAGRAADPQVKVSVGPLPAQVGLVMEVVVSVTGEEGADCKLLGEPTVDGARLRFTGGPSLRSSYEVVNGRQRQWTQVSWSFELVPERAGTLVVPPFTLGCRGSEASSEATTIEVAPRTGLLAEDVVHLDVIPSADELYVGQTVTFEVEAAVRDDVIDLIPRGDGLWLDLPWLEGVPGLHLQEIPVPSCYKATMMANGGRRELPTCVARELRGGHEWIVYSWTIPMLATRAGLTQLERSTFGVRLVTETAVQQSPFQIFGGRRQVATRVVEANARAEGPRITIRPTPEEGRPAGYTNAVGHFTFSADVQPRALRVGESCRLSLVVTLADPQTAGSGNLGMLEWPAFSALERDFRIFGKTEQDLGRSRLLEYELSPKTAEVGAVPRLDLPVWVPEEGRYETLSVGPFPLDVAAGGADGLTTVLATDEELLNDLETIRESLPEPDDGGLPPATWWLVGGVALGVVEARRAARRWTSARPDERVRKGARRQLDLELRGAAGAAALTAAFSRYLARRLGGPASGLTVEEAAARLDDRELARELRDTVGRWEASYLGGAPLDLEQAVHDARALADRVEDVR